MREISDRELANVAREIAALLRDWFDEEQALSSEDALARVIIALEQHGILFIEGETDEAPEGPGDGKIIPFPAPAPAPRRLRH